MIRFFMINIDGPFKVKMAVYDKDSNEPSITIFEVYQEVALLGQSIECDKEILYSSLS